LALRAREVTASAAGRELSPFSAGQYSRIVTGRAAPLIGLDAKEYSAHSIRRTKATPICQRPKDLPAVRLLLGRTKLESTVPYLGIEVDAPSGDG